MTSKVLHGIVNGKMIELDDDPGVPTGQFVEVIVKPVAAQQRPSGDDIRDSAFEWTEEDDRILEEIYRERKRDTRPEPS